MMQFADDISRLVPDDSDKSLQDELSAAVHKAQQHNNKLDKN
jgi:hypothetical protein